MGGGGGGNHHLNIKIWSRNAKDCSKNEAAVPFGFFMMYREGLFLKEEEKVTSSLPFKYQEFQLLGFPGLAG